MAKPWGLLSMLTCIYQKLVGIARKLVSSKISYSVKYSRLHKQLELWIGTKYSVIASVT